MNDQQHCNFKAHIAMENLRGIWSDQPDKTRLEIIKSVIWTSPDNHAFLAKLMKELQSQEFADTID